MRPWHYWLAFLLCLAVVFAAMGWVSATALRLDRSRAESLRTSAYEENVRLALWRMETAIAPLVARESMRPYAVYAPFYTAEQTFNRSLQKADAREILVPSPLLAEDSRNVLLHFQVDAASRFTSPQAPRDKMREVSVSTYNNAAMIEQAESRLAALQKLVNATELFAILPANEQAARRSISRETVSTAATMTPRPREAPPPLPAHRVEPATPAAEPTPVQQIAQVVPAAPNQQATPMQIPNSQLTLHEQQGQRSLKSKTATQDREELRNVNEWQLRTQQNADFQAVAPRRTQRSAVGQTSSFRTSQQVIQAKAETQMAQPAPSLALHGAIGAESAPSSNRTGYAGGSTGGMRAVTVGGSIGSTTPIPAPAAEMLSEQQHQEETVHSEIQEGMMKPLWVGNVLLLARRVTVNGQDYVQGCWLDWPALRCQLLEQIRDLFPDAGMDAVRTAPSRMDAGRMLAGLPVRLIPGRALGLPDNGLTPVRFSLIIAWSCVLFGAVAVGILMAGAVSLSERRGAFVSAVTHELRTPLTTFRMYSEMLSEGMVTDESKRRRYLQTLCAEGNRLSHLVENVLSYARLERGRHNGQPEVISVSDLMARTLDRLRQRAEQAGMEVLWEPDSAATGVEVRTNLSAVEQILLNLVDNACKYAAAGDDKRIHIAAGRADRTITLTVRDHGPGITPEDGRRLFRPFSKSAKHAAESAPGVGLGLALSRRLARQMGGDLLLVRAQAPGACFELRLPCAPAPQHPL